MPSALLALSRLVQALYRFAPLLLLGASACHGTTHSTVVLTSGDFSPPTGGPVRVAVLDVPPDATELGRLHVEIGDIRRRGLQRATEELVLRAVELGGNYVKIDSVSTRFQRWERSTSHNRTMTTEQAIVVADGRAFRVARKGP